MYVFIKSCVILGTGIGLLLLYKYTVRNINRGKDLEDLCRITYNTHKILELQGQTIHTNGVLTPENIMNSINNIHNPEIEKNHILILKTLTRIKNDLANVDGVFIHGATHGYVMITNGGNNIISLRI